MCRRYAQHSHLSAGRVKQTAVQYILQRFGGNDTVWSDAHEPSSSRDIKRRRKSVPENCQGRKRGKHRASVSVPQSSDRDSPRCQPTLDHHPRCTWSDVLLIPIDHSLGVGHPHLSVSVCKRHISWRRHGVCSQSL